VTDRVLLEAIYELTRYTYARTLRIESRLTDMALDFTALRAAVAQETTVEKSAVALLVTLAADLKAANDANDQEAIAEIIGTMQSSSQSLAAAVSTNTPAAPIENDQVLAGTSTPDVGPVTTADSGIDGNGAGKVTAATADDKEPAPAEEAEPVE
jgi:hypothetical protein